MARVSELGRSSRQAGVVFLFAVLSVGVATCGVARVYPYAPEPTPKITACAVVRFECTSGFVANANGTLNCANQIVAAYPTQGGSNLTACYRSPQEDAASACRSYCRRPAVPADPAAPYNPTAPFWDPNGIASLYDLPVEISEDCTATPVAGTDRMANPGECEPIKDKASNGATARVVCEIGGRPCTQTSTTGSRTTFCTTRTTRKGEDRTGCFDPTVESASQFCGADDFTSETGSGQYQEPTFSLGLVQFDSNVCTATAASPLMAYGIAAGSLGTAVHGNDSFPLNATGGSLVFQGGCDANGELCNVSQLTSMRITFSDVTVGGVTVGNIDGRLMKPAAIVVTNGVRKIPKANFRFKISGSIPGFTSSLPILASQDLVVQLNGQTASVSFSSTVGPLGPLGGVPVTITANVPASKANPGATCAGFSTLQMVMGFEDSGWTPTTAQALPSVTASPRTQGCYALAVKGSGFMSLNSARFATPAPGVKPTLKLDVLVPPGQPNPSWFGAVQLYASCPSGGMYNTYIGQAELTGKPTGVFSTVSFGVPANVQSTLSGTHNDCFFSVAVNVNATPTPIVLDNLRFAP